MARANPITKPCEACGTDFQAKAADIARGWGRFCSKSCKAKQPKGKSAGAPQPEPMRAYVEDMATRNGWERDGGEGAIEFLMRNAYATGREDTLREVRQTQESGRACTHPPGCTHCSWCRFSAPPTSAQLERARRAYHNATGIGTSKTGMFAALKAAREPQDGKG